MWCKPTVLYSSISLHSFMFVKPSLLLSWHCIHMFLLCSFLAPLLFSSLPAGNNSIDPGYYGRVTKEACSPQQCHYRKTIGSICVVMQGKRKTGVSLTCCHLLCWWSCDEMCCYVRTIVNLMLLIERYARLIFWSSFSSDLVSRTFF